MVSAEKMTVIAFVDNPELYTRSEISSGLDIKFCASLDSFLRKVLEEKCNGLILDIQKVMKTPHEERNRIFSVAADRPLMRSKTESGKALFLDDSDAFKVNCRQTKNITTRMNERVEVHIPILISPEEDPAMANSFSGTVLNISQTGCFILTDADICDQDFLHIKFIDILNKLPIYVGIRWSKSSEDNLNGFGVKFITMAGNQPGELLERYIKPNL